MTEEEILNFKKAWQVDYWHPGHPVYEFYKKRKSPKIEIDSHPLIKIGGEGLSKIRQNCHIRLPIKVQHAIEETTTLRIPSSIFEKLFWIFYMNISNLLKELYTCIKVNLFKKYK